MLKLGKNRGSELAAEQKVAWCYSRENDSTWFRQNSESHVIIYINMLCPKYMRILERWRLKQWWLPQEHFLVVTVLSLKYELSILAMTNQWRVSLCLGLYPPGAPVSSDVGMDKHVSSAGSDFQPWDRGIGGGGSTISFSSLLPSQHILNKQAQAPSQASTRSISRTWGRNIPPSRKRGVTSTGVLGIEEG